jgi:hypothetical protein
MDDHHLSNITKLSGKKKKKRPLSTMSCKRGKVFFLFSFFFLKKKKLCNFEETHADSGILNDMLKTKFSDIIVIVM